MILVVEVVIQDRLNPVTAWLQFVERTRKTIHLVIENTEFASFEPIHVNTEERFGVEPVWAEPGSRPLALGDEHIQPTRNWAPPYLPAPPLPVKKL